MLTLTDTCSYQERVFEDIWGYSTRCCNERWLDWSGESTSTLMRITGWWWWVGVGRNNMSWLAYVSVSKEAVWNLHNPYQITNGFYWGKVDSDVSSESKMGQCDYQHPQNTRILFNSRNVLFFFQEQGSFGIFWGCVETMQLPFSLMLK